MRISLRQLQVFAAIAHMGSTAAGAEVLALSQSASSASLNELESVLQTNLFDRVGKRLLLNDNGRLLLPQARQMLDAAATMERQFTNAMDGAGLRIGASTTIGNYLLPAILASTPRPEPDQGSAHPLVTIANTADIAIGVANFDLDMGLIEGPSHEPDLQMEPWLVDELVIVASPEHSLVLAGSSRKHKPEALHRAAWLLRERGSGTREAVEHVLLPHLHELRAAAEFGSAEAIKHGAVAGLGLACLSRVVVQDLLSAGKLVELQTTLPPLARHFYLIYHRRKMLSARLQGFLQLCREWSASA